MWMLWYFALGIALQRAGEMWGLEGPFLPSCAAEVPGTELTSRSGLLPPALYLSPHCWVQRRRTVAEEQFAIFTSMLGLPPLQLGLLSPWVAVSNLWKLAWKWGFLRPDVLWGWRPLRACGTCTLRFTPSTPHSVQSNHTWVFTNNFYFPKVFLSLWNKKLPQSRAQYKGCFFSAIPYKNTDLQIFIFLGGEKYLWLIYKWKLGGKELSKVEWIWLTAQALESECWGFSHGSTTY